MKLALDPKFIDPLKFFITRIAFANLDRDYMVYFSLSYKKVSHRTAALRRSNPFITAGGYMAPELMSLKRPVLLDESLTYTRENNPTAYPDPIENMTIALNELDWERKLVVPDRHFGLAHEDIVHKNYRVEYQGILDQTVDAFISSMTRP